MNRRIFCLFSLFAILPLFARAQTSEVSFPGPGTTWTAKVSRTDPDKRGKNKAESTTGVPKEGGPSKPGQDKPVDLERLEIKAGTNNVIVGTIYSSDGSKEVFYIANFYLLQKASNSDRIMTLPVSTSEQDPGSLKVSRFPGLAWVSSSNYRGDVTKQGVECKHYTHQEIVPGFPPINFEAWVRKSDGHPVICNINSEIFFSYGEVAPYLEPVALPDNFKPALAKRDRERAALDAIRRANERQAGTRQ